MAEKRFGTNNIAKAKYKELAVRYVRGNDCLKMDIDEINKADCKFFSGIIQDF
jgi:hypothetical protein